MRGLVRRAVDWKARGRVEDQYDVVTSFAARTGSNCGRRPHADRDAIVG
jgi:hypothetical protein